MKNVKYTEPSNYFSKEALKVFGLDKTKQEPKKADDQKKKENEEVRKIFKGK